MVPARVSLLTSAAGRRSGPSIPHSHKRCVRGAEMVDWFDETHGLPFAGVLIECKP
jgi:hypothetical protein